MGSCGSRLSDDEFEEIVSDFAKFDLDCDGFITHAEMKEMAHKVAEYIAEKKMAEIISADSNKDGKVSFEEFLEMFKWEKRQPRKWFCC